jgi:hypothetical protein
MKRRPISDANDASKRMDDIANLFVETAGCRTADVVKKSVDLGSALLSSLTEDRNERSARRPRR